MMKASTRLDSSHEQRKRRGSPEMNKGEKLVVVSLKVAVTRQGKAVAANPSFLAGNKENFEKYSKRTVKTQSFSVNSLVLLLSSHVGSGVSLCGKLPLLQNSSDLRIVL
uniref:Uncharacterized protein n=1 Tax=Brassica oleracea TaxID=3712 RepID=A0A3P6C1X4_BRAOL|nr:unnamed protein product [Brassica oleracea]